MLAPGNKEVVEAFVDALIREIGIYARSERVAGTKNRCCFSGGWNTLSLVQAAAGKDFTSTSQGI